jgi:release factor glutamine methyltransferase
MKLKEVRSRFVAALSPLYGPGEVYACWRDWLFFKTGYTLLDFQRNQDEALPNEVDIEADLSRLAQGEPLQYVLGKAWFGGRVYTVNPSVLIPRPETEELANWILSDHAAETRINLLDIGTGSGILPIHLKFARPQWNCSGLDVSAAALATASVNASNFGLNIDWIEADIFQTQLTANVDLIVCNPPYIPQADLNHMHNNVTAYEPHLALFVTDSDPFLFYRHILTLASNHPQCNWVYFELDKNKALEYSALFDVYSSDYEIRDDLNGHSRMARIYISKP